MRVNELLLRCYAERIGDQWQALCIDLNVAAQADTFEEVRQKLDQMVYSYVYDALLGEDRVHAEDLLSRKSPLRFRVKYNCYSLARKAKLRLARVEGVSTKLVNGNHRVFKEALPMPLSQCA